MEGALVAGVRFVYVPCADLEEMRHFYSELVGLDEIYHSDVDRTVAYLCDGLQFSVFEHPDAEPVDDGWAVQPGWNGGTGALTSWSVTLADDMAFAAAVERLQKADVEAAHESPEWVFYWSFPVKDPMGNTVEITWAPEG